MATVTGSSFSSSTGSLAASGTNIIVEGFSIVASHGVHIVSKYVGDTNIPSDVQRRRRWVYQAMRRLGTPVLIKPMYTDAEVESGEAVESPVYDRVYGQTRNRDPISHGVGRCSAEFSKDEWYETTTGEFVTSTSVPGPGYAKAPRFRGFGPGLITYLIEPDRAVDFFKLTPQGALLKVQTATAQAPWWPLINDNDLIVNIEMKDGVIVDTHERYQARMVNPTTIRGLDRRGRRERGQAGGNRFLVNQTFDMALLPVNDVLYQVETDR